MTARRTGSARTGLRAVLPRLRLFGAARPPAVATPADAAPEILDEARHGRPAAIEGTAGSVPLPAGGGRGGLALWSFLGAVVLPGLALGVYFLALAADQFIAVSKFTVRETAVAALSTEGASAGAGLDGYSHDGPSPFVGVAASYITSPAILDDLASVLDVAAILRRPEADFWARLPEAASREERLHYWRRHVRTSIDRLSGIVTLRVRAFRPEDARSLSEAIIAATERLVNDLSHRQRLDALARARDEAGLAQTRLESAAAAVTRLRDSARMLDPVEEAGETLRLLTDLTAERIRLDVQLRSLEGSLQADAARLRQLRDRRDLVARDIAELRASLAGQATADANVAAALARFEVLETERAFAVKLYEIAELRLIAARIDLARQPVYLHVFEPPTLPEDSLYPERIPFTVLAVCALAVLWAIGALVWASVEDHRMA